MQLEPGFLSYFLIITELVFRTTFIFMSALISRKVCKIVSIMRNKKEKIMLYISIDDDGKTTITLPTQQE
ncbi:Ovule protein [Caenorhabditis elegans]|uniref:Ovule protein n=1 Tax=Caenorhabditis elegans TaxID=6239 RepID=I7LHW2_CAEEL|nr:Ovule protein [Caenorhabditis elegans]CCJ09422.1 Ovule protein [Caenorhabditis elegans]|eukprot:NP_001263828.1 Uncharacterized protein CELE_Y105C5B.1418 [Caenorhabditis elegans]